MNCASTDRLPPGERKLIEWAKRRRQLFGRRGVLLEGWKLVDEALAAGLGMEGGWVTRAGAAAEPKLIERLQEFGFLVRMVNERTMRQISDLETPPGIVIAAHQPQFRLSRPADRWRFIVVLFGAQDPGNVGGVMRTADYFGADELWLGAGSADPYSPKGVRGSMGAFLRLPIYRESDVPDRIIQFKEAGAVVWGAVAHSEADAAIEASPKRILLIGAESRGLTGDEAALAQKFVRIPARGRSESLNLGVAAGILIHSALA